MGWHDALRRTHLCIAALLCVPLALLGLTGSVLVLGPLLPAAAVHASSGPSQSDTAIIAAARAAAPPGMRPSLFIPPAAPGDPAELRFADPQRGPALGSLRILVDPASLAILGTSDPQTGWLRKIHQLHANLLTGGRVITGWIGVAMLCLAVSGPFLWWPPRHQRKPLRARRGADLLRHLHGTVGIFGVAFLFIISATGVELAFPQTVGGALATLLSAPDARAPKLAADKTAPSLDADGIAALAEAAVPGARIKFLGLPLKPGQPVRVMLTRPNDSAGAPRITVLVDPGARRVIALRDPSQGSLGAAVMAWIHPLHEGGGLGPVWRGLVFLTGLLPAFFVISGLAMWLLKWRLRRRVGTARRLAAGE